MALSGKTLLFVGGGIETAPGIQLAKSLGIYTVVSDGNPCAYCAEIADDFILSDTYDLSESSSKAAKFHHSKRAIDGVICMASDVPLTVATIADRLGLPGIPITAAETVSNKIIMKQQFLEAGLPVPYFLEIVDLEHLKDIRNKTKGVLVIKPVDSRGARGVIRITSDVDSAWAFQSAVEHSPSGRVMVEEFLEGPQISTESLISDGAIYTVGFSDRNYEFLEKYAPHIIENGGDLPSFLSSEQQKKVTEAVEKTASVLKITDGVVKGDMVLSGDKAYIIEVAARLSGGYFCSHEIPLNTGVNFVLQAIKVALGEPIRPKDLQPRLNNPVSQRYLFPDPGTITDIQVPDWITSHPEINLFELRVSVGDKIPKATSHPSRAGLVITTGETKHDALELATRVISEVKINTQ